MGISVEAVITDSDLALVRYMGSDPGDELQILHRLLPCAVLTIPVTNFSLGFQKSQALQGQKRPDHILPHAIGLRLRLGPHQAAKG